LKVGLRLHSIGGEPGQAEGGSSAGSGWHRLTVLAFVVLILAAAFVYIAPSLPGAKWLWGLFGQPGTTYSTSTQGEGTNSARTLVVYSPVIGNGSTNIAYPPSYNAVAIYALGLINQDRAKYGLNPVILSTSESGQQHVDSMLAYGYFSHYDTQGYKPYMRYTLLGGSGAVFENVAYVYYPDLHFTSASKVEDSVKSMEYAMMYNDSACCSNGHRVNILSPLHNKVSIGIAYNGTTLFFDEDFENYYVDMTDTVSNSFNVTMQGGVLGFGVSSSQAYVAFDNTPAPETSTELNNGPREYDPGLIVGVVVPQGSSNQFSGISVQATEWQFTSTKMYVSFSLADFVSRHGPGIYTIYLLTGSGIYSAITSYSVFIG